MTKKEWLKNRHKLVKARIEELRSQGQKQVSLNELSLWANTLKVEDMSLNGFNKSIGMVIGPNGLRLQFYGEKYNL